MSQTRYFDIYAQHRDYRKVCHKLQKGVWVQIWTDRAFYALATVVAVTYNNLDICWWSGRRSHMITETLPISTIRRLRERLN